MLDYVYALRPFIHIQPVSLLLSCLQENKNNNAMAYRQGKMKRSIHLGWKFQ